MYKIISVFVPILDFNDLMDKTMIIMQFISSTILTQHNSCTNAIPSSWHALFIQCISLPLTVYFYGWTNQCKFSEVHF